jgi:16S rRNA (cytosine1402-N4)-methyltransferase
MSWCSTASKRILRGVESNFSNRSKMSAPNPSPRPPRRPRYAGRNPRRFEEKYKEHRPDLFPDVHAKVVAAGKTPAGSHRPICVKEVLEVLRPQPGETGVDCTLGYGGHAVELLSRILPGGRLWALDVDPVELPRTEVRLRAAGHGPEVLTVHRSNFAGLPRLLAEDGVAGVHFVLADLGVSSMQLDDPARGFTFKHDGPLDLRLNPQRGQPASALIESAMEEKLAALFIANADEPHADLLARAIAAAVPKPVTTTGLAAVLRQALSQGVGGMSREDMDASVRRVFQALRIAVNDEFSALETLLRGLPSCLLPGGRAAILAFHSGEDRRVKKAFQEGLRSGAYSSISEGVIRPGIDEIRSNPRAASAKLRFAVKA